MKTYGQIHFETCMRKLQPKASNDAIERAWEYAAPKEAEEAAAQAVIEEFKRRHNIVISPEEDSREMSEDVAWMQIYGQSYWHQPAKIYGDGVALTALRDALNKAIETGKAELIVFSSDGEGYELSVHLASYQELDQLPNHYTQEVGRTQWDDGYSYASKQYIPMIQSLQERLRKLEGKPPLSEKDKLMQAVEEASERFVDAWDEATAAKDK